MAKKTKEKCKILLQDAVHSQHRANYLISIQRPSDGHSFWEADIYAPKDRPVQGLYLIKKEYSPNERGSIPELIGFADSRDQIRQRTYEEAVKLAKKLARAKKAKFKDLTKMGSLEKMAGFGRISPRGGTSKKVLGHVVTD